MLAGDIAAGEVPTEVVEIVVEPPCDVVLLVVVVGLPSSCFVTGAVSQSNPTKPDS